MHPEQLFLTHRTSFCPVPEMKIGGTLFNRDTGERKPTERLVRSTLHWSFADLKPNVVTDKPSSSGVPFDMFGPKGMPQYIIIEPLHIMQKLIVGGWVGDLFMIGPHTPSAQSILIAPIEEISSLKKLGFKGEVIPYDSNLTTSEAVFQAFTAHRLENFQLHVKFPVTSDLRRIKEKIGGIINDELIERLKCLMSDGFDGFIQFSLEYPKETERKSSAYIEITKLGCTLVSDKPDYRLLYPIAAIFPEPSSLPGETVLYFTDSQVSISLEELLPSGPWACYPHEHTPFRRLEEAIMALQYSDFQEHQSEIIKNIIEIVSKLDYESEPFKRFQKYQDAVTMKYEIQLPKSSKVANLHGFFSSQEANVPMLPSRSPAWLPTISKTYP